MAENVKKKNVDVEEETNEKKAQAVDAEGNEVEVDELENDDEEMTEEKAKKIKKEAKTAKAKKAKTKKPNKRDVRIAAIGFGIGAGLAAIGGGLLLWKVGKKSVTAKAVPTQKITQAAAIAANTVPVLEENPVNVNDVFEKMTEQVVKETIES